MILGFSFTHHFLTLISLRSNKKLISEGKKSYQVRISSDLRQLLKWCRLRSFGLSTPTDCAKKVTYFDTVAVNGFLCLLVDWWYWEEKQISSFRWYKLDLLVWILVLFTDILIKHSLRKKKIELNSIIIQYKHLIITLIPAFSNNNILFQPCTENNENDKILENNDKTAIMTPLGNI